MTLSSAPYRPTCMLSPCPACRRHRPANAPCPCGDGAHSPSSGTSDPSVLVPVVVDGPVRRASGLIGRERELAELAADLAAASTGTGRVVLVSGDAGIGKTRLGAEVADEARRRGFEVRWGRTWEEGGAPAYWPWIQCLRASLAGMDETTAERLAADPSIAAWVTQLMPELRSYLGAAVVTPSSPLVEPAHARFAAFDATVALLAELAAARPLCLLLDDLHAADPGSLVLLRFVAREIRELRVLIVGTYREVEAARRKDIAPVFGELARDSRAVPLRGLAPRDVARFVEVGFDVTPTATMTSALHRATGGNPFFLDEVLRVLAAEGRLDENDTPAAEAFRIPERVQAAVQRRLALVSADARATLEVAAVLGSEFDVGVLAAAAECSVDATVRTLDEALRVEIVRRRPGVPGRYRFAHDLLRESVYAAPGTARTTVLHRRIADVLEERYRGDPEPHLAELAYHFCVAAPGGDVAKAVDYATRAGRRAVAVLAYEAAVALFRRALDVAELAAGDEARRCSLLILLGEAQNRAGDMIAGRETLLQAIELARRLEAPNDLARATLGVTQASIAWGFPITDDFVPALVASSLLALGQTPSRERAELLACTALINAFYEGSDRLLDVSDEAVEVARRLDDHIAHAAALSAQRLLSWSPDELDRRLTVNAEMERLAAESRDPELVCRALQWRCMDLLETGEIERFDAAMQQYDEAARAARSTLHQLNIAVWRATRATIRGDLATAEALAIESKRLGSRVAEPFAEGAFVLQLFVIRKEQGRLNELEEPLRPGVSPTSTGFFPLYRIGAALIWAETGRIAQAHAELAQVGQHGFTDIRRDFTWLNAMAMAAEVCAHTGNAELASAVYDLLAPFVDRCVRIGFGAGFYGSVAHYLGLAARTCRRPDDAVSHFEVALAVHQRIAAPTWTARTRYELAALLAERAQPADGDRAAALLDEVIAVAAELGMTVIDEKARTLRATLTGGVPAEPAAPRAPTTAVPAPEAVPLVDPQRNVFRREGEYWTIRYDGVVMRLKDTRGVQYLARLLGHPGVSWHVLELVAAVHGAAASDEDVPDALRGKRRQVARGDAGPVLDATAKQAYRVRLRELASERAEAAADNDQGRLARAEHEIEALTRELASGLGLGGRDRRGAAAAERARVNVTRSIRTTLARITAGNPALGRYLDRTVHTGKVCSYDPDPRAAADWAL